MLSSQLKEYTDSLLKKGLYRQRQVISTQGTLDFSSNDYLSLTKDFRIKKAYEQGFKHYPTGSGGSMVVCGYHSIHQKLEKTFAEALQVDDCILFSSGYGANLSILSLLAHFNAHILIDKMVHASIYDGLKLSQANYSRYLHNDLKDFSSKIDKIPKPPVVITEGIFSMSGQPAPLAKLVQYSKGCDFIVDEAHAFGVIGDEGLGSVIEQRLTQDNVPLRVIPLGKAYAACGAIVAGKKEWIDALQQLARAHIYSTALSPAMAFGLLETLDIVRNADNRREKLSELTHYFRKAIKTSGLTWSNSSTPIQQLQLGCPHRALKYAQILRQQNIICLPMRSPTVTKQATGLRIILNYHHTLEDIDNLFKSLLRVENPS